MFKRLTLLTTLLLWPSLAWAQSAEDLLPSQSQIFLRYDGMKAHQAAYDKSAAGKMMKGETGTFFQELWKYARELIQIGSQNHPEIGPWIDDSVALVSDIYQNGIVIGIEADKVSPPVAVHAIFVFPKGSGEQGTIMPLIQKITANLHADVKDVKVGKRFVHYTHQANMVYIGWWAEGSDVVVYLGTDDPTEYARRIDDKKTGIGQNPLYARVRGFQEFDTVSRGYFDLKSIADVSGKISPLADNLVHQLGFKQLGGMTFASGFDGVAQRTITEMDTTGPRQGFLALAGTRKISLKDLPPLPSDLTGFSAGTAKIPMTYDAVMRTIEGVMKIAAPDKVDNIQESLKAIEGVIGINIKDDLFSTFGDLAISYSSSSEGILGMGQTLVVQMKDSNKMKSSINRLMKAIPANQPFEVQMSQREYKGGEIFEFNMKMTNNFGPQMTQSFGYLGFYKDWLIYSKYPQAVKGFILRGNGELPAWKANERISKALQQFPSEFTSISIDDPRETTKTMLAVFPVILQLSNTYVPLVLPGARTFDLTLIPHAEEATLHLFPNITVGVDDGKKLRTDTRSSFP